MEAIDDVNSYLSLKDSDGTIKNEFTFIYAKPGFGKTMAIESLIEEYHRAGYVILCLSDVKDSFEMGYAMFRPRKPFHIHGLKQIGKPIETHPVKLYHPFTYDIPTNVNLPEINFYGFSLKDIGEEEWGMLCETDWENDVIRILSNASSTISKNDGLYSFLHLIENNILGRKNNKEFKRNKKIFNLKTSIGSARSLNDIASYFLKFQNNPFLLEDNSKLKLDWKEILNDNKHYHVFGSRWIADQKLQHFCVLSLLMQFLRHRKDTKKPVLVVIPEIRNLVPSRVRGYVEHLARAISKNMSIMRNYGKGGNSVILDSQVWMDVNESVKNSGTQSFYGQLGGEKDIETLGKAKRFKSDTYEHLQKPEIPRTYLWSKDISVGGWKTWLPGHLHAEEDYDFFDIYKDEFKDKMKNYSGLIKSIKKINHLEIAKIDDKIFKKDEEEKKEKEDKKKVKEKSNSNEIDKLNKKLDKSKNDSDNDKLNKVREMYLNKDSLRKIRSAVGWHHDRVKKSIEMIEKELKEQKDISHMIGEGIMQEEIDGMVNSDKKGEQLK